MSDAARTLPSPSRSLAYPLILALSALDAAAYSIVAPVLPGIAAAAGAGPATIGALSAAFPVGILLGFPLAGGWIARRDAESLLPASAMTVALGALPFVAGAALPALFASRFVMGLGSAGLWMGVTYTTLERWPGLEHVCMSRVFAAYSAGALLGPAFGLFGGTRAPFAAYALLAILGALAASRMGAPGARRAFRPDRSALRAPGFAFAAAGIAFGVLALGVVDGVLPLHLGTVLGQQGIAALFIGIALIHAVGATVAARLRPVRAVAVAAFLICVGVAGASLSSSPALWLLPLGAAGIGVGFAETGSVGALLRAVPPESSITAMVVWSQVGIVGYVVGPLAGGAVAEVLGFGWLWVVPVVAAAAVWGTGRGRGA